MHQPHRGDAVEAWIKNFRDNKTSGEDEYGIVDALLDEYRLGADTGQTWLKPPKEN